MYPQRSSHLVFGCVVPLFCYLPSPMQLLSFPLSPPSPPIGVTFGYLSMTHRVQGTILTVVFNRPKTTFEWLVMNH